VIVLRRCAASGTTIVTLVAILFSARPVQGQPRFEIGASATWTGGYDAGGTDALLTRPSPGSPPLTLFATESRVDGVAGVRAQAAWFVTRRLAVEGAVEYSRPLLRTTILNDFESADGSEAVVGIRSYLFGGSVLYHFGSSRIAPFAFAGAGGLRQLDEEGTNVTTGAEVHAGGGVKYRLSTRLALRVDVSASARDKSVGFETGRRVVPEGSAGIAYRF
jgi:hypothetical protein